MYSPSAGNETPAALELSDRYELAGAAVSQGGYDAVCAGGGGTDDGADVRPDVGPDVGEGGEGGVLDPRAVAAPEAQPATKKRTANAVATRRFIDAQTPGTRRGFPRLAI
jgi:hypothetical protein